MAPRDFINELTLEMRYKPNPEILDHRGSLAAGLLRHMNLTEWQITENRVDVFTEEQDVRCFIAFQNAGITLRNTKNVEQFTDQLKKFFNYLALNNLFKDRIMLNRVGVRSRTAFNVNLGFAEIVARYTQRITKPNVAYMQLLDGNITDIAAPLSFKTDIGDVQTNSGPMEKEQLSTVFQWEEKDNLPDVNLYIDFDYFIKSSDPMYLREISTTARQFALANWQWTQRLADLVLE